MAFSPKQTFKAGIAWLGRSEDCLPMVALTCLADAFIKPFITLNNPNKSWDERYYAAKRETIHHINALPNVFVFSYAFKKLGEAIVKPAFRHLPGVSANASTKLLMDTAFSSFGVIAANFWLPVMDNMIIHPIERFLDPGVKGLLKTVFDKGAMSGAPGNPTLTKPDLADIASQKKPLLSFAASQATLQPLTAGAVPFAVASNRASAPAQYSDVLLASPAQRRVVLPPLTAPGPLPLSQPNRGGITL